LAAPGSVGFAPPTANQFSGSVTLVPDQPASPQVGNQITWTATATNSGAQPVFQFSVGPAGGSLQMMQDFSHTNTFTWVPMQEGTYNVQVIVENNFGGMETAVTVATDTVNSRVTGTDAVITPTANPLVALYSAPPTTAASMQVDFRPADAPNAAWVSTDAEPCVPGLSTNFLVAGMLPNTTYAMMNVTSRGSSSIQFFTTGALPADLNFPQYTVVQAPGPSSDLGQNLVFHMDLNGRPSTVSTLATNLQGRVAWYYDPVAAGAFGGGLATSLVPGGTVLLLGAPKPNDLLDYDALREVDLAGNTLRETTVEAINPQLIARGDQTIYGFNHEAQRLPNGDTAVLGTIHRTINLNGTPTVYVADMVLVLDQNFQVAWTWNPFNFLDVHRLPTLGDTAGPGEVDWTHANSIAWSPEDSNLVVSLRAQDWVIKIDYANGTGDGHVIWRLGKDGDFTINSTDPNPWFSHQHDVSYIDNTTLTLFDDGNARIANDPSGESRGQVLTLNEKTMTASLVLNANLGNYSAALGAAQQLANGDYAFTSGFLTYPNQHGESIEVHPDGSLAYALESEGRYEYRSSRLNTLYGLSPITTTLASPPNSTSLVRPMAFTATVSLASAGTNPPTGTATVRHGTRGPGTRTPSSDSVASFTTTALPAGAHTITVTYDGDANFMASSSPPVSRSVNSSATTTYRDSTPSPSVPGQAGTFTATVTPAVTEPFTAGGTVTLYADSTPLGNPVPVAGGTPALTTAAARIVGLHPIMAVYPGDANFVGSTGAVINQVVTLPTTAVSLTDTPSISTLRQAATFAAAATPAGGPGTPTWPEPASRELPSWPPLP
jgi:hypothetical protein